MKKMYAFLRLMAVAILFFFPTGANSQSNPVAVDDTATGLLHQEIIIDILANDYDPQGDSLYYSYLSNPQNGYASPQLFGNIKYVNHTSSGPDSLRYTVRRLDDPEFYATAWVFIDVLPNQLPIIIQDTFQISAGVEMEVNVFDFSFDPDQDEYVFTNILEPVHGNAYKNGDSTFKVEFPYNHQGVDSAQIILKEMTSGASAREYVYFDVYKNPEFPSANNDTVMAWSGDTVSIPVLNNDFDPQGDNLEIMETNFWIYGHYYHQSDTEITIVPKPTADTGLVMYFEYFAMEQENYHHVSNPASGYLHVQENPNLPVAINDTVTVQAGFPAEVSVLLNDTDLNGDELKIKSAITPPEAQTVSHNDSILTITPYSYITNSFVVRYRIVEKENPAHYSGFAEVLVQVEENTNQPVAQDDFFTMTALETLTFNPLENDSDPDGLAIKIADVEVDGFGDVGISVEYGSDSTISLISHMNYSGDLAIPYRFCRSENPAMISNKAFLFVTIIPDESRFYAVNDTVTGWPGISAVANLVDNDHNPEGVDLEISQVKNVHGVDIHAITGSGIDYTIGFAMTDPVRTWYYLSSPEDSVLSAAQIFFEPMAGVSFIDSLDINNIKASFSNVGLHFYNPYLQDNKSKFEVPAGSGKQTIRSNSLWIGGYAEDGLHVSADIYRLQTKNFWPGPVSDAYQDDDVAKYKVWKISKAEIEYHISHYQEPGYEPIRSIATWPGNGNPNLGQALQLAPFFDQDNDGIYNPYAGDVPEIRGDQSLYFIFNDMIGAYDYGNIPLNLEIHGNAYAFDQPDDSAINNTVFLHYDIYNRSDFTYTDTYIGLFTSFDLGDPIDNYIGSDVQRGTGYVYNADPVDGDGESGTYGENPPVQGVTILGGVNLPDDQIDNPTGGCDESINGFGFEDGIVDNERMGMTKFGYIYKIPGANCIPYPQLPQEYYNLFQGKWKDNTYWVYGGNGHVNDSQATGPECNFVFPDDSDPLNWGTNCDFPNGGFNQNGNIWTEETQNNLPSERKGINITGPFTFAPGEVQSLDVAFVYARDNDTTDLVSAIDIMNQRIDTIRNRVENGGIIYLPDYAVGISEINIENIDIPVFPNPTNGNKLNVDLRLFSSGKQVSFKIIDLLGKTRRDGVLTCGTVSHVDVTGLRPGVYFLVIGHQGNQSTRKLMIN